MSILPWIKSTPKEKVGPTVSNRVARQILIDSGLDPDANFPGFQFNETLVAYRDVYKFSGVSTADKAIAALRDIDPTGGFSGKSIVLDFRRFGGLQLLDKNIITTAVWNRAAPPTVFLWGSAEYRRTVEQTFYSNTLHLFEDCTHIMMDMAGNRVVGKHGFQAYNAGTLVATTSGSKNIVLAGGSAATALNIITPGITPLHVFGFKPSTSGGNDITALHGTYAGGITAISPAATEKLYLVSTTGQNVSSRYLRIDNELIEYSSIGSDATGPYVVVQTRGYGGTTAAAHAAASNVERVTYSPYYAESVDKTTGTVVLNRALDITATALDTIIGVANVKFKGSGIIDGNKDPNVDDTVNPMGINGFFVRYLNTDKDLVFRNWDHGGVNLSNAQDCWIEGRFKDNGRSGSALGANVWLFQNCLRNYVKGHFQGGYQGVHIDDRTTVAQLYDGISTDNSVHILSAKQMSRVGDISSCHRNTFVVDSMLEYDVTGVVLERSGQWQNSIDPQQNVVDIRSFVRGAATEEVLFNGTSDTSGNIVICQQRGVIINGSRAGLTIKGPEGGQLLGNVTGGLTINANTGDYFKVTATGVITFNFPVNGWWSKVITIEILNSSGAAMTPLFNAVFKLTNGAAPAIPNGSRWLITFYNNGAEYLERLRTATFV